MTGVAGLLPYPAVMLAAAWLTAGATTALALLAAATAWFARKAFLAQSDEVRTLKRQLEDQQALSAKQTPVLELQAQELTESLAERKREADERHRAQEWLQAIDE